MTKAFHTYASIGKLLAKGYGWPSVDTEPRAFIEHQLKGEDSDMLISRCLLAALVETNQETVKQLKALPSKISTAVANDISRAEVKMAQAREKAAKAEEKAKLADPTVNVIQLPNEVIEELWLRGHVCNRF